MKPVIYMKNISPSSRINNHKIKQKKLFCILHRDIPDMLSQEKSKSNRSYNLHRGTFRHQHVLITCITRYSKRKQYPIM